MLLNLQKLWKLFSPSIQTLLSQEAQFITFLSAQQKVVFSLFREPGISVTWLAVSWTDNSRAAADALIVWWEKFSIDLSIAAIGSIPEAEAAILMLGPIPNIFM